MLKETVIKSATSTKQKKLEKEIGRLRIQDVMNIELEVIYLFCCWAKSDDSNPGNPGNPTAGFG